MQPRLDGKKQVQKAFVLWLIVHKNRSAFDTRLAGECQDVMLNLRV